MKNVARMVLLLVAGVAAIEAAQSRPNLTGTWINLSDPNATDARTAASLPNALLTITHAGDKFDLTRSWSNAPIKEAHVCDGRENKNGYSIVVERTTCKWEASNGGTLVIEGTIGREDGTVNGKLRTRIWLDATGVMHVERMRHVTTLNPQAEPRTYTQQYKKLP